MSLRWYGKDIFRYEKGGNPVGGYALFAYTDSGRTTLATAYTSDDGETATPITWPLIGDGQSFVRLNMPPGHYYFRVTDNNSTAEDLLTAASVTFPDDDTIDYTIHPSMKRWVGEQVFSPYAYKGKGDGSTSDIDAMLDLWTDLSGEGGGVLDLGSGTWVFDKVTKSGRTFGDVDTSMTGGIRITGDGPGKAKVIQIADFGGDSWFAMLGRHNVADNFLLNDVVVDNFTYDGQGFKVDAVLDMWQGDNSVVNNVRIANVLGRGLAFNGMQRPHVHAVLLDTVGDRLNGKDAVVLLNSVEGGTYHNPVQKGDVRFRSKNSPSRALFARGPEHMRMDVVADALTTTTDMPLVEVVDDVAGDWWIRGRQGTTVAKFRSTGFARGTRVNGRYDKANNVMPGEGAGLQLLKTNSSQTFVDYSVDGYAGFDNTNANIGFDLPNDEPTLVLETTARSADPITWNQPRRGDLNVVTKNLANTESYAPDLAKGTTFVITATNNGGASTITINDAVNGIEGQKFDIVVVNSSGGALTINKAGGGAWDSGSFWKFTAGTCAMTPPANTKERSWTFRKTATGAKTIACSGGDL